ncbi:MAG: single-stranded-DNA-specific exonuclease RecJ [Lachnospiraceae bacterium]
MEKWFVAAKKADFDAWSKKFHITPVTARIIRNRDILSEEEVEKYLHGSFLDLYPPELMLGMEDAAAIMSESIALGRKIRVIGDYDVDGITSSHILTKGLRKLGGYIDTVIPHRMKDGYGLNERLIEEACEDGIQTIITCDNGIAAAPQIALAAEKKMTVVVTDHHEVPYVEEDGRRVQILPPAAAVVDPKQDDCQYPNPNICGAVVAYKLIELMFRRSHLPVEERQACMDEFLQLSAVATVCDVMDLLDENRIIVKEGLKKIRTAPCMGLKALIEANGVRTSDLNAFHLGFVIGPCLNATGRLDSAVRALELLDCENPITAARIAGELKEMNESRKAMTLTGVRQAEGQIEKEGLYRDKVLVVFLPQCHESLAGIIAGRIKEQYGKPCFVLTRGEEGVKGSGRSIESYHMYDAMVACKELFTKFGGHKMAAGLSLAEKNLPELRRTLNAQCMLTEEDFQPKIHIDVPMPLSYVSKELAEEFEILEPFGNANPKPLFATKNVHFLFGRKMGKQMNFARFTVVQEGKKYELLYFGSLDKFHAFLDGKFGEGTSAQLYIQQCDLPCAITYRIGINSFRGKKELQIVMENYQ